MNNNNNDNNNNHIHCDMLRIYLTNLNFWKIILFYSAKETKIMINPRGVKIVANTVGFFIANDAEEVRRANAFCKVRWVQLLLFQPSDYQTENK